MAIDPENSMSAVAVIFSAAGGGLAGGGVVGLLVRVIWAQLNRRIEIAETALGSINDKLSRMVQQDDCRQDRSSCSANLGRSIDEVKDMLKEMRQEIRESRQERRRVGS